MSTSAAPGAPGSSPRRLTHLHGGVASLAFSPDGLHIACLYIEGATRPAGALAPMKPPAGVIGVEGLEIQRVATIETASGEFRQVTPPTLHVYEYDWAPDSGQLAYVAAPPPGKTTGGSPNSIRNGWAAASRAQYWTRNTRARCTDCRSRYPAGRRTGKEIAFIGGLMSDQGATGGDIYLISAAGGAAKDLTQDSDQSASWIHWLKPTDCWSPGLSRARW